MPECRPSAGRWIWEAQHFLPPEQNKQTPRQNGLREALQPATLASDFSQMFRPDISTGGDCLAAVWATDRKGEDS